MTRPVTVLPRLALTASTRTRQVREEQDLVGRHLDAGALREPADLGGGAALLAGARRDDRPQRARVHLPGEQAGLAGGEPDRAPRGDRALPRAPELGGGDVDVADELARRRCVARATSAPEATVTAFAAAFAAARSAWAWVTPWAASCAPASAAWRSASVASPPSSNRARLRLARLLDGGVQRALLGGHVGVRLRLVALAVGGRDGRPGRRVRRRGLRGLEPGLRGRDPQARRPDGVPGRVDVDARLRDVRGAHGALRLLDAARACSRASRACAAAASATCSWSSCASVGPNGSQPSAEVEARDGHLRGRVVAAVHRAGGEPEPSQRTLELEHVLPTVAGTEVAVHRDPAGQHEHRAAVDRHGDRPGGELGARLRRAGDDVAARALLDPRGGEDDRLRRAVAHRAADDDLGRERTADDRDRDRRRLRRGGVGRDLGGRADLARGDPAEDRDGDERGESQGDDTGAPGAGHRRSGPRLPRHRAPAPRGARPSACSIPTARRVPAGSCNPPHVTFLVTPRRIATQAIPCPRSRLRAGFKIRLICLSD